MSAGQFNTHKAYKLSPKNGYISYISPIEKDMEEIKVIEPTENSVSIDVTANSELNISNNSSEVVEPFTNSVSLSITELNGGNNIEINDNNEKIVLNDLEDDKIEIIKPTTNSISNIANNTETDYSDIEDNSSSLEMLIQMIYSKEDTFPTKSECLNFIMPELTKEVSDKFMDKLFDLKGINPDVKFKVDRLKLMDWLKNICYTTKNIHTTTTKSAYSYVIHMIAMIDFILKNPNNSKTSDFIAYYNSTEESNDNPLGNINFHYPNYIFCNLLMINNVNIDQDICFEDIVYSAFPCKRNIWERKSKRYFPRIRYKFDLPLSRIHDLGLEIESTKHFNHHLSLKGNTIKILSYDLATEQFILVYQYNRLARLYAIHSFRHICRPR
ncbi:12571_t:CDS:2 [Cetraspora pellucida]|uniref:12571_t:CDS:1 n=1 Tax=Cetraspora pellucida TaxID=1433469 RepID=A0ACA9KJN2_9GLOM|nr:12571_t:CDS:2 [Cetraspora pellucida]